MRAYAILMMVQGHLVDALLDPIYRDSSIMGYYIWNFMRGINAPIFFFASGSIFIYLLMRQEKDGLGIHNPRVKKGFKRTLMLLGLGYLLQISPGMFNFFRTWDTQYLQWFFAVHVLHVIGIAILLLVIFYLIARKLKINIGITYFILGNLIFLIYPDVVSYDWNSVLPFPLANFLTKQNMSVFTVIPWAGFSMLGGSFGYLIFKRDSLYTSYLFLIIVIILGFMFQHFSGYLLFITYKAFSWDNLLYLGNHNFLYFRLGQVLIITGILGLIARSINIHKIITTIGSETLSIYFAHNVVIYGSLTTFGLAQSYGKMLSPLECVLLAIIVVAMMIAVAYYAKSIRTIIKKYIPLFRK